SRLATLRVRGPEGVAEIAGGPAMAAARVGGAPMLAPTAHWSVGGRAKVSWDARYPMAMIRDARTGQVLSFARGSSVELEVPGTRLQIVLSDGVRSTTQFVVPQ